MSTPTKDLMSKSDIQTEEVKICPLCGEDKAKFLFWNFDRMYRLPGKFATLQCERCGLIRLSPRPDG